jgi:hypothetical protein
MRRQWQAIPDVTMTIRELQRIVVRLSNGAWVRWWSNYGDRHENCLMAIQVLEPEAGSDTCLTPVFIPTQVSDLEKVGFQLELSRFYGYGHAIYTIPRTNEDGTPYVSNLF